MEGKNCGTILLLGCQRFNVSTSRFARTKRETQRFFVTLEQRNVKRKRNFLRSNVIFVKISRFARTKRET
jgi:hypothetical protein